MALPKELTDLSQWLVSGDDKAPRDPKTGQLCDFRDASHYVSYDEARAYAQARDWDVGFALTGKDPYTVIDLDATDDPSKRARQELILESFKSYAELSRSGNGVHIWCRGHVPRGARRDSVEVYSENRYMICTGNSLNENPVTDQQELLDILFEEITRGKALLDLEFLETLEPLMSDAAVVEMGSRAVNGHKFDELCRGDWEQEYPSQSEADYALMNMLCYYSRSNEQCKRLFRMSALGKRGKAQRDAYLDRMIVKIRSEEGPRVDLNALQAAAQAAFEKTPEKAPLQVHTEIRNPSPVTDTETGFYYPPGFIGEIARYITDSAVRPMRQAGVTAALALAAGILGRQYNISGTGLNQYLILLAKTGVGKEGGAAGIERLLAAARPTAPVIDSFIGPGTFASGQGIIRTLDEKPSFVSILGEFGHMLQAIADPNASGHMIIMKRVLLDLYSKSGQTGVLYSTAYSDKEKNTKTLLAPAMTIFGESTPEAFYAGLSATHVAEGLVPRFLIIEHDGNRPKKNKNAFQEPDPGLTQRLVNLVEISLRMQANQTWAHVDLDESAHEVLDHFDRECDRYINQSADEGHRQLWNRAHLKALKLTGLLAAADRPHTAVATGVEAQWAVKIVRQDIASLENRFASGDVGTGHPKQMADIKRVMYMAVRDVKEGQKYADRGIVSYRHIMMNCNQRASFKSDRAGASTAIKRVLQDLEQAGLIQEIDKRVASSEFDTRAKLYAISDWSQFQGA